LINKRKKDTAENKIKITDQYNDFFAIQKTGSVCLKVERTRCLPAKQ